eukprot:699015_1
MTASLVLFVAVALQCIILAVYSTVDMYAEYYPCKPPVQSTLIHGIPPEMSNELSMDINDQTLSDFNEYSGYKVNTTYRVRISAEGNKMYYIWAYNGTIDGGEDIQCDGKNLLEYFVKDISFNWHTPHDLIDQERDSEILIMYTTHHTALNLQSFIIQPYKPRSKIEL